jgi:hypothetical protein
MYKISLIYACGSVTLLSTVHVLKCALPHNGYFLKSVDKRKFAA